MEALAAYIAIAKPLGAKRIAVRYVNQIKLWAGNIELSDYFQVPLGAPDGLDFTISSFFVRYEAIRPDNIKLIQSFASVPSEIVTVILDLDVIREGSYRAPNLEQQLLHEVDSLREVEREAFEAAVTDKLREVFDADDTA